MGIHLADNIDLGSAVLGGVIIGISSTLFLLLCGKLTGISGFVESSISPAATLDNKLWSWSYLAGLIVAGVIASFIDRERLGISDHVGYNVIVGALFVGFGTRMGCGCTSGHGISGLPRLSLRALVAVSTFMCTAALSAYSTRQLTRLGVFPRIDSTADFPHWDLVYVVVFLPLIAFVVVCVLLKLYYNHVNRLAWNSLHEPIVLKKSTLQYIAIALFCSLIFGAGLAISGMCSPQRVIRFLDFSGPDGWDPSLIGVMGGGVIFNTLSFHLLHNYKVHVIVPDDPNDKITLDNVIKMWKHPANIQLPLSFVAGSAMFGIGWGMCGICPGPGLVNIGAGSRVFAVFLLFLFVGMALHEVYKMLPAGSILPKFAAIEPIKDNQVNVVNEMRSMDA